MTVRLDAESKARFRRAIDATWQVVGHEFEQAAAEAGERLTAGGIAEGLLDFVTTYGRLAPEDKELWNELSYGQKLSLARAVTRGRA